VPPRPAATLLALFLAATALRPQIVGAGPLFPDIQHDLDTSHAVVGLLGTIPVLCMGLFAPPAAFLAGRLGTRQAMTWALLLIGVFGIARAAAPGAWLLVLLTWPIGIGMGLAGAIAPVAVKERFAARPASGTGLYTTGIQLGSTVTAAIAVPLAGWLGGWRWSLAAFSVAACVVVASWTLLTRGEPPHERRPERPPKLPWRSPVGWLLVVIFGLMASGYYGLNAWLPDAYVERGWSEEAAGGLIAALNVTAIPASFVVPWLSDRRGGRQPYLVAMSLLFVAATVGLVTTPSFAWGFALLSGLAQGSLFALVLTVPLDLEHRPDRVGALVGMMLGLGYTIGAASPFLLGGVRDLTGSFEGPLWLAAGFLAALALAVLALPRVQRAAEAGS
jgi:CP family cyanate transporter-like MFS transporter